MEKSYHEGRIALGLHGAVLEAADNSLRQRRISVGCELETMPKGDAAVAECRRLLVNLIDSRESALEYTNRESEPHEKTETESLFSPVTGCQTYQEDMRSLINSTNMQFATNIFWYCLPYLSRNGLLRFLQMSVAKLAGLCPMNETLFWTCSIQSFLAHRKYDHAEILLTELDRLGESSARFYAYCGHLNYLQGRSSSAVLAYEKALKQHDCLKKWELFPLYYRSGTLFEQMEIYFEAKKAFHEAAKIYGTCRTWIGCGTASYKLNDLVHAEYAFRQALAVDNGNPLSKKYLSDIRQRSRQTMMK
ncbi:uncharacterized protein LOC129590102 isoform X3 [Paramacrobiotus metropolitanus]|nr:uncharacterized protein LOC129590102 isoform X3 [Paramacrobiotus metropolitanus]